MICVPFSLNFSCCTERQVSRDRCCQESYLPPLLSGIYVLSRHKFILYIDHLEALRGNNNNQQTEPGVAKLDLLCFFSPQGSLNWPKPESDSHCSREQARQTVPVPGPLGTALEAGKELLTRQTPYAVLQHLAQVANSSE